MGRTGFRERSLRERLSRVLRTAPISVALGFVGLTLMGLEFALVARFRPVAAPFGSDALVQFHRQIGLVGLAFALVHVALSASSVV